MNFNVIERAADRSLWDAKMSVLLGKETRHVCECGAFCLKCMI